MYGFNLKNNGAISVFSFCSFLNLDIQSPSKVALFRAQALGPDRARLRARLCHQLAAARYAALASQSQFPYLKHGALMPDSLWAFLRELSMSLSINRVTNFSQLAQDWPVLKLEVVRSGNLLRPPQTRMVGQSSQSCH